MNFELEKKWREATKDINEQFGETLDLQSVLFLIGAQELNKGYQKLTKDQKIEVLHIAVCSVLAPYGYYEFIGRDEDGWPHFENKKKVPNLSDNEQEVLLKEAVIDYLNNLD